MNRSIINKINSMAVNELVICGIVTGLGVWLVILAIIFALTGK